MIVHLYFKLLEKKRCYFFKKNVTQACVLCSGSAVILTIMVDCTTHVLHIFSLDSTFIYIYCSFKQPRYIKCTFSYHPSQVPVSTRDKALLTWAPVDLSVGNSPFVRLHPTRLFFQIKVLQSDYFPPTSHQKRGWGESALSRVL